MHNQLIKVVLTITMFIFLNLGYAQNNSSSSPYSRYGIGDLSTFTIGPNSGMGNIGIGVRNPLQVNSINPASYSVIDTTSFIFEIGVNSKFTNFKTSEESMIRNDFNFSYLNIGFPVTKKWGVAIGIKPYANRGYNIYNEKEDLVTGSINTSYRGEGTFSKAYLGNSVELFGGLSFGVNSYFLFGKTALTGSVDYIDDPNQYDIFERETLEIHDFGFQFGAQYSFTTKKDHKITLGATFEPETDNNSYRSNSLLRVLTTSNDQIVDTLINNQRTKNEITVPASWGAGISYRIPDKLIVGFDYFHENWAGINPSLEINEFKFQNSNRYVAGIEYIPRKYSISHYYEKINYRLGAFYENSYMNLNNNSINSFGINFGLGLPVRNGSSLINLSWEIGRRGTTRDNLIRENYTQFTLHFMLFDRWFLKRQFD